MLDLHSGMTISELMLRVAESIGLARYVDSSGNATVAALPDQGSEDRAQIRRAVLQAIEELYRYDSDWSFAHQQYTLTLNTAGTGPQNVDSLATHYRLPIYLGSRPERGYFVVNDDNTYIDKVQEWHWQEVERYLEHYTDYSGAPTCFGIRPNNPEPTEDQHKGPVLIVAPTPDRAYTLSASFRVVPPRDVEDGDRHYFGRDHDETIIALAELAWLRKDEADQARINEAKERSDRLIAHSLRIDQKLRPIRSAQSRDTLGWSDRQPRRDDSYVLRYNGTIIE